MAPSQKAPRVASLYLETQEFDFYDKNGQRRSSPLKDQSREIMEARVETSALGMVV
jgi:hypothetical protein